MFSRRGYHPSSIDEIAQAAGMSKALIYEHFESKLELHVSLIEMHAGELFERVAAAAAPGPDAAERLEAGLDAVFTFVEERRGAWQMLFRETADPETAAVLDRVTAGVAALVAELIAQDPGAQVTGRRSSAPRGGDRDDRPDDRRLGAVAGQLVGRPPGRAAGAAGAMAMELLWLGLDRLRAGERCPRARVELRTGRGRRAPTRPAGPSWRWRGTARERSSPSARWTIARRGWPAP